MLAKKGVSKKVLIIVAIAAIAILALAYSRLTGMFVSTTSNYDNFAKCLTEKGVVMYGTKTCPHCKNQKEMFGDSFKYINYVDCIDNSIQCTEKGIQFVPAWYIDGKLYTGEKTIEELKSLSRCEVG